MAIACAIAIVAMLFVALDAFVDVNSGLIAKRIEVAQVSIAEVAMSRHQLAAAFHALAHRGQKRSPSAIE